MATMRPGNLSGRLCFNSSSKQAPVATYTALEFLKRSPHAAQLKHDDHPRYEDLVRLLSPSGDVLAEGDLLVAKCIASLADSDTADWTRAAQLDAAFEIADKLADKQTLPKTLGKLNEYLALRTYMAGPRVSIGDIAAWASLEGNSRWRGERKKAAAAYPNVLRWHETLLATAEFSEAAERATPAKSDGSNWDMGGTLNLNHSWKGRVVTRFPPEPSGYLHIGHSKALLINAEIAAKYDGKLLIRFDDTNPSNESEEFESTILADIRTLGIPVIDKEVTYTSDYFQLIYDTAVRLIKAGVAFVDDTPQAQMQEERKAGIESRHRTAAPAASLALFDEMTRGTERGLKCCLRIKMDMAHTNKTLGDPVIYRCNLVPHHRTGAAWKVYPTYDFACPIVDSIEGVTHAMRTLEYSDRKAQYEWMWDLTVGSVSDWPDRGWSQPIITEYARLAMQYTVMSKRKLKWLVETGRVTGWDDPRFPTVRGITRRGLTLEALKLFMLQQATSRNMNHMEWDKIWAFNSQVLDREAPRYVGVALTSSVAASSPADRSGLVAARVQRAKGAEQQQQQPEALDVLLFPKDAAKGAKRVPIPDTVLIEATDLQPVEEGEEITLVSWGNVRVTNIQRDAAGAVTGADVAATGSTNFKGTKKIHWIPDAEDAIPATLVTVDHLVTVKKLDGQDLEQVLNPNSWIEQPAVLEPWAHNLRKGDRVQLLRKGFFIVDDERCPDGRMRLIAIPSGKK